MKRRELLVSVAAIGIGTAGCLSGGLRGGSSSDKNSSTGSGSGSDGKGIDPVTVETVDARGSQEGERRIPSEGNVSVIEFFATWCAPCKPQMDNMAEARKEFGDTDVEIVSVTNEAVGSGLSRDDIREWWNKNGGKWTVAIDNEGKATQRFGVLGLPYMAITDEENRKVWSHRGLTSPDKIVEKVEDASPDSGTDSGGGA